jgi:hypothetical protein
MLATRDSSIVSSARARRPDGTRVQGRDGVVDSGAAYVVYVGDVRHEVPAPFLPSDSARATDRTVEPG